MSSSMPFDAWGADASPFHAGELAVQRRAGVDDKADLLGRRGIRREMPEQHRAFFAQLPFFIVGGVDGRGQPWATIRAAEPGFVSTPDAHTLRIDGGLLRGDPLAASWVAGAMLGGLGLQPQTRRRNRVNGVVTAVQRDTLLIDVQQSFGNCPKYIQSRTPSFVARDVERATDDPQDSPTVETATQLNAADRALLAGADTFFIASANLSAQAGVARGVDVSHRGGPPGFVRIDDAHTLTTPDYSGNNLFNTLGNLLIEPRAGLLFVDFVNGDLLYIAARAEIVWDDDQVAQFAGAKRLVRFHVDEVRRSRRALPFRWSEVEAAPQFAAWSAAAHATGNNQDG